MAGAPAAMALDGGDPRLGNADATVRYTPGNVDDPNVYFEEYLYWAEISRKEEESLPPGRHPLRKLLGFQKQKDTAQYENRPSVAGKTDEKYPQEKVESSSRDESPVVSDEEWKQAARAARTATWGGVFYLITTDILGPWSVPWALAQMGYGPGIVLYFVFFVFAVYSGILIWHLFLKLDSLQYPLKNFGDVAFRIYGRVIYHGVNFLQALQLIFNVGVILVSNGNGVSLVNPGICYIVCIVIWLLCGMVVGQIRTLQRFGWIANLAVWINVANMILTMAVVTHSHPNWEAAGQADVDAGHFTPGGSGPPPPTYTLARPTAQFETQVVGLMQAVYAYGGSLLFVEFMNEMRRPWDFWKGAISAQVFIFCVYLFYGIYVYSFQGQYAINPAYQGMSPKAPQTAGVILHFLASLIAAGLYGNIGIKVVYQKALRPLLGLPDLNTKKGKILWVPLVPLYWALAFVLAAAIPQFSNLSGLVAAVCILQFTYTFPPFLMLGYKIKKDAMLEGEGFDPQTGHVVRHDSGMKRWWRGYSKNLLFNLGNTIYFLGSCATAVLGIYSAVVSIIQAYAESNSTAFSCRSPTTG